VGLSVGSSSSDRNLPYVDDIEALNPQGCWKYLSLRVWWKLKDYCLDRLFEIWVGGKIMEIIFLQVVFHG
jgi:hypothetical protein